MSKNCCFVPSTPIFQGTQIKKFIVPKGLIGGEPTLTHGIKGYSYNASRIFQVDMNCMFSKPQTILTVEALADSLTSFNPVLYNPFFFNKSGAVGQNGQSGPLVIPANTDLLFFNTPGVPPTGSASDDKTALFTYFYDQKNGFLYIDIPWQSNPIDNSSGINIAVGNLLLSDAGTGTGTGNTTIVPFRVTYI
jgi:hypothetical protein